MSCDAGTAGEVTPWNANFFKSPARVGPEPMKRIAVWAFYGIGALAILYLALSAYAAFTGRALQPGDPIHIFRKPDAPSYSAAAGAALV
jgi:hypothetical protein